MWEYMIANNMPSDKPYLVRKSSNDVQDWNSKRKTWQTNPDRNDAFLGLDTNYDRISEEEANRIVEEYGLAES